MYNYRTADELEFILGGVVMPPVFDTHATELRGFGAAAPPQAIDRSGEMGTYDSEWIDETQFLSSVEMGREIAAPPIPSKNVQQLLTSLGGGHYSGQERRLHRRHAVAAPVIALPLTADYHIDGEPLDMTTTNVSLGGAALMHTQSIDVPYLVLDFSAAGEECLQVVLQILRIRRIGSIFEISGQFIGRLPHPPV